MIYELLLKCIILVEHEGMGGWITKFAAVPFSAGDLCDLIFRPNDCGIGFSEGLYMTQTNTHTHRGRAAVFMMGTKTVHVIPNENNFVWEI